MLQCVLTTRYYAYFVYTASEEIRPLHSKRRMVIIRAEFGGKQSHKLRPSLVMHIDKARIILFATIKTTRVLAQFHTAA